MPMYRKEELAVGETYHIFNKSIAGYVIFKNAKELNRMRNMAQFFQLRNLPIKFSQFTELVEVKKHGFKQSLFSISGGAEHLVQVIAYCFMPTHIHFILKQLEDGGISIFMSNLQNSYARYFNTKYKRHGPLWVGRFKNRHIKTEDELLSFTRYIHLNPTTDSLVKNPEDWEFSSYREYLRVAKIEESICEYEGALEINPKRYKDFVESRKDYQKTLAKIKKLIIE